MLYWVPYGAECLTAASDYDDLQQAFVCDARFFSRHHLYNTLHVALHFAAFSADFRVIVTPADRVAQLAHCTSVKIGPD